MIAPVRVIAALAWAWIAGIHSYNEVLFLGALLGMAGAGNSGTAFVALIAPSLAAASGWGHVFVIALIPLTAVLIFYVIVAKDAPDCPAPRPLTAYLTVLRDKILNFVWMYFLNR